MIILGYTETELHETLLERRERKELPEKVFTCLVT